jgi:hypothetical protein
MAPADNPHHPVVTMAALYGAGGSVFGPRVAERLGVAFLDREIPIAAARSAGVSDEAVADVDDEPRSGVDRLVATLSRAATTAGGAGGSDERLDLQERRLRAYIEQFLAESAVSGGVTMGRGGMVVLRWVPWALHVHLGGPREARLRQRMALEGIDHHTAMTCRWRRRCRTPRDRGSVRAHGRSPLTPHAPTIHGEHRRRAEARPPAAPARCRRLDLARHALTRPARQR